MKAEVVILYQNRETTQEEATTGPLGFSYCHLVTPAFDHQPRLHEKELHLSFLKIQILGAMFVKATLTILSDLLTNNETLGKLDYFIVHKRMRVTTISLLAQPSYTVSFPFFTILHGLRY